MTSQLAVLSVADTNAASGFMAGRQWRMNETLRLIEKGFSYKRSTVAERA
jgi:hypothetical protein